MRPQKAVRSKSKGAFLGVSHLIENCVHGNLISWCSFQENCRNTGRPPKQIQSLYSELAIARTQPLSFAHNKDLKAGRRVEKLYSGKKGKTSGMPWVEVAGMGKLEADKVEVGHPTWLVWGAHLVLLVGPELEVWAKTGKPVVLTKF